MVLADLAAHCRMYQAPQEDLTDVQRNFRDGQKATFARIIQTLAIPPEEVAALQQAARLETLPDLPNEED
ncbi:hypothetical protein [Roseibium sp.]|uniref:Bbp19 family protein n=1 Tax=Roseibium sp. TaxID=1936156 RepID=UPI001B2DA35D|nr:hypothetical protein [Roseibium sp.]MBO6858476.1 hypothetical protein [Roseibium sp.]